MAKHDQKIFVREIADDLQTLYQILSGWDGQVLCPDASPLNGAVESCRRSIGQARWDYSARLIFRARAGRHPIPAGVKQLTIDMSVAISGHPNDPEHPIDPLDRLEFNLRIYGDGQEPRSHCSWHLDRHLSDVNNELEDEEEESDKAQAKGTSEDEQESGDAHPRYHFQFGGRHMSDEKYGNALLLGSPRLAHPPLDAVLGVDFVLANFRGAEWRKLLSENRNYQRILCNSQKRFWRPYIQSICACWANNQFPREAWHPRDVWPSMILPAALVQGKR